MHNRSTGMASEVIAQKRKFACFCGAGSFTEFSITTENGPASAMRETRLR